MTTKFTEDQWEDFEEMVCLWRDTNDVRAIRTSKTISFNIDAYVAVAFVTILLVLALVIGRSNSEHLAKNPRVSYVTGVVGKASPSPTAFSDTYAYPAPAYP